MTVRSYAKEDPWQDDNDGNHGRPVTLARMGDGPDTEAIWTAVRGAWQPFPDLWARRCFDSEAFDGGEIQEPLPDAEMDLLCEADQARRARETEATAKP